MVRNVIEESKAGKNRELLGGWEAIGTKMGGRAELCRGLRKAFQVREGQCWLNVRNSQRSVACMQGMRVVMLVGRR